MSIFGDERGGGRMLQQFYLVNILMSRQLIESNIPKDGMALYVAVTSQAICIHLVRSKRKRMFRDRVLHRVRSTLFSFGFSTGSI